VSNYELELGQNCLPVKMVIQAEVGDQCDMGVLIDELQLTGVASGLVDHVVDTVGFVPLAVGIDHRTIVPFARKALFLQAPLFVAVPADDVGVPGAAVVGLAIVAGWAVVVLGWKPVAASLECGNLLNFLLSQILTVVFTSFFWLKVVLDSRDLM
jgi:hypothetical protein